MNRAQQEFGQPKEFVVKKVQSFMSAMTRDFIEQAPFAVLATANGDGDCDASPKGGAPGFVKVLDEHRLIVPDIAGNNLFQSYENIESNPKVGLVFLLPGCDWTVRVNGRAEVVSADDDLEGAATRVLWQDDNTKVRQGLLIEVSEAYAHCPRAFLFSKLWDPERIKASLEKEPNAYWLKRWRESMKDAA
jgi:PPOX class probable FMN-dependent enzyme